MALFNSCVGMHPELIRMKKLDPINQKYLQGYIRALTAQQLRPTSIKDRVWRIYSFLIFTQFNDAKTVNKERIEDYIIHRSTDPTRRGRPCSPATIQGDILALKLFFRWLLPRKVKSIFKDIKPKKARNRLPVERVLNRSDVEKLVGACDTIRDRALVMLLWDSGARINELLSRNVGNIEFDQHGGVMVVDGKTGQRRLRLTACVGDLQSWINTHPMKENPVAPLFITYHKNGFGSKRLNSQTVRNRLQLLAEHAHVTKPVNPHAFRHARATDLAKNGFNEMELRKILGWEPSSQMPEVYLHLSGADVENKVLQKAGLIIDTSMSDGKLDPKQCPRCRAINSYDSIFCRLCSAALTDSASKQIEMMHQSVMNNPQQIQVWARQRTELNSQS
jgi:site-specific recombinase XerD